MENKGFFTELLLKVNELKNNELNLETIKEAHKMYLGFIEAINNTSDSVEKNGYAFLINEIRYILFDLICKTSAPIRNGIRKKIAKELEENVIENIITVNNHAFICERNEHGEIKTRLIEDYLMDITDRKFLESKEQEQNLGKKELVFLGLFINEMNEALKTLDLDGDSLLVIENNAISYNGDCTHIFLSDNIYEIIEKISHKEKEPIEIIVQNGAENYYYLELEMVNERLSVVTKEFDMWTLNGKQIQSIKVKR